MKKAIFAVMLTGATLGLTACGDSSSGGSAETTDSITTLQPTGTAFVQELEKVGTTSAATNTTRKSGKFELPAIRSGQAGTTMTIPAGPLPSFSARRTLNQGNGAVMGYGDNVALQYDMFSWSTGELVESTTLDGSELTIALHENGDVPNYLVDALLGRKRGDTIQVVFEAGMEDLPEYLNPDDAYILIVQGR